MLAGVPSEQPGSADAEASADDSAATASTHRRRFGVLAGIVAAAFGLFYAYELWEAVSSLVTLNLAYAELGERAGVNLSMPGSVLWPLLGAIVLPLLTFVLALCLGWRRPLWQKALLFLAGWALVNAFTLNFTLLVSMATNGGAAG